MAVTRPTDLTVAKNQIAAETIAATILDLLAGARPATARDASAFRLVRGHADELFELSGMDEQDLKALRDAARRAEPAEPVEHAMNGQG